MMTDGWRSECWKVRLVIALAVGGAIASSWNGVLAQNITLDGSLGPAGTLTGPKYLIPQAVGTTVDSNLFHSFEQFSLDTNEAAIFQSAANIRNILSRVTGGSASSIDGLIRTQSSNVNLFLINPSGIVFGPNASLNVGSATRGSFVATTVDAMVWPNGSQFSATNPGGPSSLLTIVGDPSGFLSSLRLPQPITSSGSTLRVYEGQSLLLLGGDVILDNSSLFVNSFKGGRIELGGTSGEGRVGLSVSGNNLSLSFQDDLKRANVSLINGAKVDVTAEDGGSIAINTRNLNVLGGSHLFAGIGEGLGSAGSQAGDITLNATETIKIAGSRIFDTVDPRAVGNGGNINITAGSLSVTDRALLATSTLGQGDAGSVTIDVRKAISFDGESAAVAQTAAVGRAGDINITAGSLSVTDGALLAANTFGSGNAGSVTINVREAVSFDGESAVFSTVEEKAVASGGGISITAESLSVTNGSQLQSLTRGQGNAGSVTINVREAASFDGVGSTTKLSSGVFSNVESGAVGNSGDINLTAGSLSLTDGAQLQASVRGPSDTLPGGRGDGGDVNIDVQDIVTANGVGTNGFPSGIRTRVQVGAVGNGGDITIEAGSLFLTNSAELTVSTLGQGNAGSILVQTDDTVSLLGTANIFSTVEPQAVGNGGGIDIRTGLLYLTDGSQLTASTLGRGNAGPVIINARNAISFDGVGSDGLSSGAFSTVDYKAVGNGGSIDITARSLSLTNGAAVAASTRGQGNAGDIRVNTTDSVTLSGVNSTNNSGLYTRTAQEANGQGGEITVNTAAFRIANGAVVNARTSNSQNGGSVTVNTNTFEAANGGQVITTTRSSGRAGNISLNSTDSVTISGSDPTYADRLAEFGENNVINEGPASGLFASTTEGSTGQGGDLSIATGQLIVQDGAQVSAATSGSGRGGTVGVAAPESVTLSGGGRLSARATADGNAGNLTINTRQLMVQDGAEVSTSTTSGVGGNITLDSLNSLQVSKGGQISASTATGQAGSFNVNAADSVHISTQGSGLFAQATDGGDAGSLTINTRQLTVEDGAQATVSSPQGQAGNLIVTANSLRLDQGNLTAVTGKGQGEGGANINLQVGELLLMDNNSQISADALRTANGGNINIDTDFLIALPPQSPNGSDIRANAVQGNGGRLNITAQGILGIDFRPSETTLNDITASSEFGTAGVVTLNTSDVEVQNSLTQLSANFVSPEQIVAGSCLARRNVERGSFTVTGTGGLPSSPYEAMSGRYTVTGVQPIQGSSNVSSRTVVVETAPWKRGDPIQEAQGMVVTADGRTVVVTNPQLMALAKAQNLVCH